MDRANVLQSRYASEGTAAWALQAAEKLWIRGEIGGKHTSGAKAHADYIAFTPGINPRPTLKPSFSAACEALTFID